MSQGQRLESGNWCLVALTAVQAQFQLTGNCRLVGKAAEFCVPVEKTVVNAGDAPGSLIGSGQDLSDNDYVCYKIKCPRQTIPDTTVSDQFSVRGLTRIKTAGKLCVPAVKGVATTTTTTTTTTSLPPPMCPVDGTPVACNAYANVPACTACCGGSVVCATECGNAGVSGCTDMIRNTQCAIQVNAAVCGSDCCP